MSRLNFIYSARRFAPYPSFQIVYEWEDILAAELGLTIWEQREIHNVWHRRFEKNGLVELYHKLSPVKPLGLRFVMTAKTEERCQNNRTTIPVIIDFWLKKEDLPAFYNAYRHVPLMLVTSLEVYEFLQANDCPIPLEHWALSLPDERIADIRSKKDKQYDFCFFGRPSPFFLRLVDQYAIRHPGFEYVLNQGSIDNRSYITNTGRYICADTGRQSYLNMISQTRISCYTTPGLDESKSETNAFNQVTPRVFEMLSNACHVIGHYPDNPDTRWYHLSSVVPNVDDYAGFERQMDAFLSRPFDVDAADAFLKKHTTSMRVQQLKNILERHDIALHQGFGGK